LTTIRNPIALFRNAKQFAGLEDCQARDLVKTEFYVNASLTALNLARVETNPGSGIHHGVPVANGPKTTLRNFSQTTDKF